jgi:hypothetical protein
VLNDRAHVARRFQNVANKPYVIAREGEFSPSQYSHPRLISVTVRLRF